MKQLKIYKFKIKPLMIQLTIIKYRNNNIQTNTYGFCNIEIQHSNFHESVGVLQFGSSVLGVLQFAICSLQFQSKWSVVVHACAKRRRKKMFTCCTGGTTWERNQSKKAKKAKKQSTQKENSQSKKEIKANRTVLIIFGAQFRGLKSG